MFGSEKWINYIEMKLSVLLLISLACFESRGNKIRNDPAPGRSGPPPLYGDFYTVESHEAYRPALKQPHHSQELKMSTVANKDVFDEVISGISSENVEYIESEDVANPELIDDARSEHITVYGNDELTWDIKESFSTRESESAETVSPSKCDSGAPSLEVASYLKLGGKVIERGFNYGKEQKSSEKEESGIMRTSVEIDVDVIHDVFETSSSQGGLLEGIIYKGKFV